jgi:pimeloyl-ACP methyl ester carboxylesterase
MTRGNVRSNGININYNRLSGPGRPIVLLHGITDDGLCWLNTAKALSARHDVVMPDMRGHGGSDAPKSDYTIASTARDIRQVVHSLKLEKPIVIGHSLGGVVALEYAGRFKDEIGGLILVDSPPFWNLTAGSSVMSQEQLNALHNLIAAFKRKTYDELRQECKLDNPSWADLDIANWIDAKHRFSPKIDGFVSPKEVTSADFHELIRGIACPSLLLFANPELGSTLCDSDIAMLISLLPRLRKVSMNRCGHSIHRDELAEFVRQVEGFQAADPAAETKDGE